MTSSRLRRLPKRAHLVGIGGIGLSAIARVLKARGCVVTGSDLNASDITRGLEDVGIKTYAGHRAEQVEGAELVVRSSAIPDANVEVTAARAAGIPVVKRHEILGALLSGRRTIAVAGTHGKTTTSAMIAFVLEALGRAPSYIIGGMVDQLGSNARVGDGTDFVVEADEYDRTFLAIEPDIAVVTNVEMDHPDCYPDMASVREAFRQFLEGVAPAGSVVACAESVDLGRVLASWSGRSSLVTYGRTISADYGVEVAEDVGCGGLTYWVTKRGREWTTGKLSVPGVHNVLNACAALAVADIVGLDADLAADTLAKFRGVRRRFEVKGEARGITVVDDYAHHPTEVRATLDAARECYRDRRLWVVFQPHTYSRVEALFDQFAGSFDRADSVIVMDVYAARSREMPTISASALAGSIRHGDVRHIAGQDAIVTTLLGEMREGDVLLTLGAGDGYLVGERVLAALAEMGSER